MNNNALYNAVHSAAGRRRIRCIADIDGLRQSKNLGVDQEAERQFHIDESACWWQQNMWASFNHLMGLCGNRDNPQCLPIAA